MIKMITKTTTTKNALIIIGIKIKKLKFGNWIS